MLPAGEQLTGLTGQQGGALKALNAGPIVFAGTPPQPVAELLNRLLAVGAVSVTGGSPESPSYTVRLFRGAPRPRPEVAEVPATATLSRFTVLRRVDGLLIAENPRSFADIEIHDGALAASLVGGAVDPTDPEVARFWADLLWSGHAIADRVDEDSAFTTRSWGPHELWFHRHSTVGDRDSTWLKFGPTRWADGEFEPIPARPEVYPGTAVTLPVPDLAARRTSDVPLAAVTEDRVSTRSFDDNAPITAAQLGELLYRCARVRSVRVTNADRPVPEELPSKPFSSGGSVYELELYPVIRNVDGVEPGMYHYDAYDHVLRRVAGLDDAAVQRIIAPAALTLAEGQQPQVLLVLAARFGRLTWTYEQMPYAVILKHVGVLTHSLYLTATALGLGGVAQGYGDTAAFAAATGRDELAESLVGTFALGSVG